VSAPLAALAAAAGKKRGREEGGGRGKEGKKRVFYTVFDPLMGTPVSERRLRRGACGGQYFKVLNTYFAASPQSTNRMLWRYGELGLRTRC